MSQPNPKVDAFLTKEKKWRDELAALRAILLDGPLTEDFKWYKPVYTFQGSNLIALAGLKQHCWIAFFRGALLHDPAGLLAKPGPNSQSGRVIKFTSLGQVVQMETTLKAFVHQAIEAEKAGLKVDLKESKDLVFPEEFINKLDEVPELRDAFDALTPGRRRAYNFLFFSAQTIHDPGIED